MILTFDFAAGFSLQKDPSATTSTTTSMNCSTTTLPPLENSFDDSDNDNKKLINDFVNSTDPDRKTISHSGLISQAQRVLDGKGNQETKQLVVDAIQFRTHQDLVVRSLLMRLFNRNLLIEIYCRQCVDKELNEFGQSGQEAVISINEQLWQVSRVRGLVSLPGLFIHYEEAYDCLLTNVVLNSLRHDVDVEGVVTHIRVFFQEDEPEEVEEIE